MKKFRVKKLKGIKIFLFIGILVTGLLLTACSEKKEYQEEPIAKVQEEEEEDHQDHLEDEEDHDHDDSDGPEDLELSDWNGEWNSVAAFMDEKEVHEELEEKAKEENISLEEAMKQAKEENAFPFDALKIEGEKITFYDGIIGKGSEKLVVDYTFKEAIPMEHGGHTMYWYAFETKEEGIDPYLILLPIHGEDILAHWHARLGKDLDEMVNRESDIGTFVRPSAPMDLIAEELVE